MDNRKGASWETYAASPNTGLCAETESQNMGQSTQGCIDLLKKKKKLNTKKDEVEKKKAKGERRKS